MENNICTKISMTIDKYYIMYLEFFKISYLYSVRKNSKVDFSQKKFFSKIATSLKSTFFRL